MHWHGPLEAPGESILASSSGLAVCRHCRRIAPSSFQGRRCPSRGRTPSCVEVRSRARSRRSSVLDSAPPFFAVQYGPCSTILGRSTLREGEKSASLCQVMRTELTGEPSSMSSRGLRRWLSGLSQATCRPPPLWPGCRGSSRRRACRETTFAACAPTPCRALERRSKNDALPLLGCSGDSRLPRLSTRRPGSQGPVGRLASPRHRRLPQAAASC
jgi:hypothetical protein